MREVEQVSPAVVVVDSFRTFMRCRRGLRRKWAGSAGLPGTPGDFISRAGRRRRFSSANTPTAAPRRNRARRWKSSCVIQ